MYDEPKKRTLVKTVTWRVFATMSTAILVYYVTGSVWPAVSVSLADTVLKSIMYYAHERAWAHSRFGLSRRMFVHKKHAHVLSSH